MDPDRDWQLAMSDFVVAARPTHGEMSRLSDRIGAQPPRPVCTLPEVIDEFVRAISRDQVLLSRAFEQIPQVLPHVDMQALDELFRSAVNDSATQLRVTSAWPLLPVMGTDAESLQKESVTSINITQQFISSVQGAALQQVQGDMYSGLRMSELSDLIARFGGETTADLRLATTELEEGTTSDADRIRAAGSLRRFLAKLGDRVESSAIAVLTTYVDSKLH
jgi:hypothetical protein